MAMRPCNLLKVAPPKTAIPSCGFWGSKGLHVDSRLKNPNSARQTEPLTNKFAPPGAGQVAEFAGGRRVVDMSGIYQCRKYNKTVNHNSPLFCKTKLSSY
jgi:hypothetical protein